MKVSMQGIYCPIITPFSDEGVLAEDALISNIQKWNESGLSGYVVLGSTGETPYLTIGERKRILALARTAVSDKLLIAGTGQETTVHTIEFTKQAAELGADAALVLTPHYYKPQMTGNLLERHYLEIAEAVPIPILLYNVPAFTGIDLDLSTIARLCEHPNIIGMKDSTANLVKLTGAIEAFRNKGSVLVGNAGMFLSGLSMGAPGAVLAISNVAAAECVRIFKLIQEERFEEARGTFIRLLPLATQLISTYGIPAIKEALDQLGFYGGPPRKPLTSISHEAKEEVSACLRTVGLLANDHRKIFTKQSGKLVS